MNTKIIFSFPLVNVMSLTGTHAGFLLSVLLHFRFMRSLLFRFHLFYYLFYDKNIRKIPGKFISEVITSFRLISGFPQIISRSHFEVYCFWCWPSQTTQCDWSRPISIARARLRERRESCDLARFGTRGHRGKWGLIFMIYILVKNIRVSRWREAFK